MLDTLVKDSSNPHSHVSPEQTKFVVWYNYSHGANWGNNPYSKPFPWLAWVIKASEHLKTDPLDFIQDLQVPVVTISALASVPKAYLTAKGHFRSQTFILQ